MQVTTTNVGYVVRQLREARGVSQKDLGELSRVGQPQISKIENGERNPSVATLVHVVEALKASLQVVINEEVDAPNQLGGDHPPGTQ